MDSEGWALVPLTSRGVVLKESTLGKIGHIQIEKTLGEDTVTDKHKPDKNICITWTFTVLLTAQDTWLYMGSPAIQQKTHEKEK